MNRAKNSFEILICSEDENNDEFVAKIKEFMSEA